MSVIAILSFTLVISSLSSVLAFLPGSQYLSLTHKLSHASTIGNNHISLNAKTKSKWSKGDLGDRDVFENDDLSPAERKKKFKLDPETVYFEGAPSPTEIVLPAISILTVIGIIPFVAALARQVWVRYKFTSRRISIQSGIGGSTQTEIIYPDVSEIRYAFRAFGASGDMVLFLKDGAKVELRHVPNFKDIYEYVLGKCDDACREKSMKMIANT